MVIGGILFDKDGTLVDYQRTWVPINRDVARYAAGGDPRLAADLLRRHGQDPETDRITAGSVLAAGSVAEIAAAFAAQLGDRAPPDLAAGIARRFRDGGARAVLIDGVAATLAELKRRGLRLGVASNDTHDGLLASLGAHGLLALCDFVAGCDAGFGAKPDPRMALAFCRAVGLAPSEIAVVGDAVHDLAMARAAGARLAVGVLSGTSARADLAGLADLILGSVNELVALPACAGTGGRRARA